MAMAVTDGRVVMAPAPATDHSTVEALTGGAGRRIRLPTLIRDAPATAVYLVGLMITTAVLVVSSPRAVHWLVASASTNLHNMTIDPLRVLVVSAFWVPSTPWIWLLAPLLAVVMASAERLFGTGRTLLIFAAGHLGATALTVAAIGAGVAGGLLPHRLAYALDVGPSYGLVALAAVLATRLPGRRLPLVAAGALLAGLATAVALGGDFTDGGHLVAALIGLALSRVVTRPAHRGPDAAPARGARARWLDSRTISVGVGSATVVTSAPSVAAIRRAAASDPRLVASRCKAVRDQRHAPIATQ